MLVIPAIWSNVGQYGLTFKQYHLHITSLLSVIEGTANSLVPSFVKTKLWLYKLQNGVQLVLEHFILNFEHVVSHIIHLMLTKTDYFGSVWCRVLMKKPAILYYLINKCSPPYPSFRLWIQSAFWRKNFRQICFNTECTFNLFSWGRQLSQELL